MVSIHAPTRGATRLGWLWPTDAKGFDPRPHARGDNLRVCEFISWLKFRSTPPREGRLRGGDVQLAFEEVSIHAPTRGATPPRSMIPACTRGFDPRPHARGDSILGSKVTCLFSFDPRPHARGDACVMRRPTLPRLFRSTPPREGRHHDIKDLRRMEGVSIHAPTRGATLFASVPAYPVTGFDPRPHARGDRPRLWPLPRRQCFDPRPHARGDPPGPPIRHRREGFDPRPHARGGLVLRMLQNGMEEFDPRPHARGDHHHPPSHLHRRNVSIHAPTRGATSRTCSITSRTTSFRSRPHARGDLKHTLSSKDMELFRSTPPREGRRRSLKITSA